MFGWEFPPHISGGLGTACYGLTKALATQDVEIIFVVPKAYGDEDKSRMNIVGANTIPIDIKRFNFKDVLQELSYVELGSNLIPYVTEDDYYTIINKRFDSEKWISYTNENACLTFSGGYSGALLQEVANYAVVAKRLI